MPLPIHVIIRMIKPPALVLLEVTFIRQGLWCDRGRWGSGEGCRLLGVLETLDSIRYAAVIATTSSFTQVLPGDSRPRDTRLARRGVYGGTSGRVIETVGNIGDTRIIATSFLRDAFRRSYTKVSTVYPSRGQHGRADAHTVAILEVNVIE